jgi:hypothetical protein
VRDSLSYDQEKESVVD